MYTVCKIFLSTSIYTNESTYEQYWHICSYQGSFNSYEAYNNRSQSNLKEFRHLCTWLFFGVLNPSALKVYSLLFCQILVYFHCKISECLCQSQQSIPFFSLPRSRINTCLCLCSSLERFSIYKAKNEHILIVAISSPDISKDRAEIAYKRTEHFRMISLQSRQISKSIHSFILFYKISCCGKEMLNDLGQTQKSVLNDVGNIANA